MTEKILYTPEETRQLLESGDAIAIDIRDTDKFDGGHIPGAVNTPDIFYYLAETTQNGLDELHEKFAELFGNAGLDGNKVAILYEDALNTQYGGSCRGYWLLKYLGYPHAGILDGGFAAWKARGGALSTEPATTSVAKFPLNPNSELLVTRDEMLAALDDDQVVILDNRDQDEWLAESSSPYGKDFVPRKGRMHGAIWLEWYALMDDSEVPAFRTPGEITQLANERGIQADDDIIIYCFKGARASNTFVALRLAGFRNLRIYLGSWNEWSKDPSLPIETGPPRAAASPRQPVNMN